MDPYILCALAVISVIMAGWAVALWRALNLPHPLTLPAKAFRRWRGATRREASTTAHDQQPAGFLSSDSCREVRVRWLAGRLYRTASPFDRSEINEALAQVARRVNQAE